MTRNPSIVLPRRAPRFVETSTSATIRSALDQALRSGDPSRVVGASGLGKSAAIAELIASDEALGCEVTAGDTKTSSLYRLLLRVYEVPDHSSHTLRELRDAVYCDLPEPHAIAPLILDEYQRIEPLALRELLTVQRVLGFALVLVGNGETIAQRTRPDQLRAMDQIRNRFGMQVELDELLDEDFLKIADEWSVEDNEATRAAVIAYGRMFSLHQLTMLLSGARKLSSIGAVRLEHLRAVVELTNRQRLSIFKGRGTDG